ncbi:hypothetical protein PG999_012471 [Apiospora kogelbergensis]|uniref:Uncharacterized protein n=1 Tax=Apiospora kogelbergensis TaxID=1337665 RepID=A0AAW0Q934_9PEZI
MQKEDMDNAGGAADSREQSVPKRRRPADDSEGGEKKRVKTPSQEASKRKRDAEDNEDGKDKASKRSKPPPPSKKVILKKPIVTMITVPGQFTVTSKDTMTITATGASISNVGNPKDNDTPSKGVRFSEQEADKEKVKRAPKLGTSAATSNWNNRNPDEKLGDLKIRERERALKRLNEVKKKIEGSFRDLYAKCFDPYEKAYLDTKKGEDRRDPKIAQHLDTIEGLFGRRDNEREDLRRRVLACKDPKVWAEADAICRRIRKDERSWVKDGPPEEQAQVLAAVLRSIPILSSHVDNSEARIKKEAARVRADIRLEKTGKRNVETRHYEVPLDRFAAKTFKSIEKTIDTKDVKSAKEMLERAEAPDESPGEGEGRDDNGEDESDDNAEYVQL